MFINPITLMSLSSSQPMTEDEIFSLVNSLEKVTTTLRKYKFYDEADTVESATVQLIGFSVYFYKKTLEKKYPNTNIDH